MTCHRAKCPKNEETSKARDYAHGDMVVSASMKPHKNDSTGLERCFRTPKKKTKTKNKKGRRRNT